MKNKFKLLITMFLATMMILGNFAACMTSDTPPGGEKIDESKSQLYVMNYNGGFGSEWFDEIIERFESVYEHYSFEPNKEGVQIVKDIGKTGYSSSELFKNMNSNINEVLFSEDVNYLDYINNNYMLDISDVLTDVNTLYNTLDPNADGKTVKSKLNAQQTEYFTVNQKIYALPHYLGIEGIIYDMDLFNSKSLYYAKNGVGSEDYALDKLTNGGFNGTVKYTNYNGAKSAGPDGKHGTYDDGLPATYSEFFDLCVYMTSAAKGINNPFTMSGEFADTYIEWIMSALAADYEGKEQTLLNFNFNGTAKNLATISGNSIVLDAEDTQITAKNGYELYRQAGRYYALSFLEGISGYFDPSSWIDSDSAFTAQQRYVRSDYEGDAIPFFAEGVWWENEARDYFEDLVEESNEEKYSRQNRKFGFLPLPKATYEQIGSRRTLVDNHFSLGWINANKVKTKEKITLAKTFLKFCYTDYSLEQFTIQSGLIKAINYDISQPAYDGLSEFSKQLWNLYESENVDVIYQYSKHPLYLNNPNAFKLIKSFTTNFGTGIFTGIVKNGKTAKDYFEGINKYQTKARWEQNYSKYFEG